ncbi:TIGR02281 family clan AA aspartic protease [uncultured Sphingomonas sp.]|uniref:retropepsin-like aspartic protease family protein n=1 Tax=uncultured Sphingomonas sp. TaxID=158754 RepID=UPI0035CA2A73
MIDQLSHSTSFYLIIAAIVALLIVARRVRLVGTIVSLGTMALAVAALLAIVGQRGGYDPLLGRVTRALDLTQDQKVVGKEMTVPMATDGHFWVRVTIGGVKRRMLVDSGATVTALSARTAAAMGVEARDGPFPMLIQTANGTIRAETGTIPELRIGNIVARDLPVVVSPAFGEMDVIGMNFLSRLKSWRVEGRTLILTPHHPQPGTGR